MIDKIAIIGVLQDLGASRRGVDMGAPAMRVAGLHNKLQSLGYEVCDFGNIHSHDIEQVDIVNDENNLNFLDHIVETCYELKKTVEIALDDGYFPLILGGDHSITIGTMAGMKRKHGGKTGILWIDAHGDLNTATTSPSGNIHGMPFAVINNHGDRRLLDIGPSPTVSENNSVQIAARDLDPGEIELIKNTDISMYTMADIDERGISAVTRDAIERATSGVDHLHVSFDIDALDPNYAPGTGTSVAGGLTYREAHYMMEQVHRSGKLCSFEMVEVNPTLDVMNKTAKLAVGLIASALGKKIA